MLRVYILFAFIYYNRSMVFFTALNVKKMIFFENRK